MKPKYNKKIADFIWMKILPIPLFLLTIFSNSLDWLEDEWDEHMEIMQEINDED